MWLQWSGFLRTTQGLSYAVIGEMIGDSSERCQAVLDQFTASFNFTGAAQSICSARCCLQWLLIVPVPVCCSYAKSLSLLLTSITQHRAPGLPFETALRGFLETFRLPGESQKIYRIMQAFSVHYWAQCGRTSPFRYIFKQHDYSHLK